jgi:hypothetical protein
VARVTMRIRIRIRIRMVTRIRIRILMQRVKAIRQPPNACSASVHSNYQKQTTSVISATVMGRIRATAKVH